MRKTAFGLALASFVVLGGCAALDTIFGVDEGGNRTSPPGGSPVEGAGGLLSLFVPWASTAALLASNIYTNIRRKQYLALAGTAVEAVSIAKGQKDEAGKIDVAELLRLLAAHQDAAGVRELARSMARKAEAKL